MVFPYEVKFNGEYYEAGEDVPMDSVAFENKNGTAEDVYEEPPFMSEPVKYSKTDINKMNLSELKSIANEIGIDDVDFKAKTELKEMILSHFGL